MKVIEKGRPQKGWAKELNCTGGGNQGGGCGAKLLVEAGDLFETQSQCRDETDYFVTFRCPECSVLTDVTCSLPSEVREAARRQAPLWRNPNWKPA